MELLDARRTADRLPYPELADSIREVALARRSGVLLAPPRLVLPLQEGGVLLVMPASDEEISITKLVTVHPENPGHGLPTIQGEVVVMDATTGERLGLLEGGVVTARRTAALVSSSLVFVDTMEGAKEEAGDLIQADQAGAFEWEEATPLEEALHSTERPESTVVFKSVGHALWDLAAARTAFPPASRQTKS